VHPIERLRDVARFGSPGPEALVREAAGALAGLGDDTGGRVLSCKRLVDRHPGTGPLWWLCARLLTAPDPRAEAWRCVDDLEADPTAGQLAGALPDDATITVVGWPDVVAEALPRRGDVEVLVVESGGDGAQLVRRLQRADVEAVDVPESGVGAASAGSDVVLLEALMLGPSGFLAPSGSRAAAAVARSAGVPVWLVAGVGRALPKRLWEAALTRLAVADDAPWDADVEVVPLELVDHLVGNQDPTCPPAAELLA
jgi:hypothetical protein